MARWLANARDTVVNTPLVFDHETLPQRVRFGSGAAADNTHAEIARLGARRVMLIAAASEDGLAEALTQRLPVAIRHTEVTMHVPIDVATRARTTAATHDIDAIVSIGGGSATGLAKAVALATGAPIVAVPTTYAGSEATDVWGLTEGGVKTTGVDSRVLPRSVVYDATLTLTLPLELSVASGLNALAHCIDSMWGPRADPLNAAMAAEGIRALNVGLPGIVNDSSSLPSREHTLYAAYVSAVAFASAGSGLHHKTCHVLGGMFDLPHAQTHAVVLPHVLGLNASAAPAAEARIAAALESRSAVEGLSDLYRKVSAPSSLRELGMPESGIDAAAAAIVPLVPANNPAIIDFDIIRDLISQAWRGERT